MQHPPFRTQIIRFFSAIIVLLILGYSLFEARKIIEGPQLTINSPSDGATIHGGIVIISGTVQNAAYLSVNDVTVLADAQGNFSTKLTPPPGYEIFKVTVEDRFKRSHTELLHLVVE